MTPDVQKGGIVGFIDVQRPTESRIAAYFGLNAISRNNGPAFMGGFWAAMGSNIVALAVPASAENRDPALPFSQPEHRNTADATNTYHNLQVASMASLNETSAYRWTGTQVVNPEAKVLIARALTDMQPFELGVRYNGRKRTEGGKWEDADPYICGYSNGLNTVQVNPPLNSTLEIRPVSGIVEVSNSKSVVKAPGQCAPGRDALLCKIDVASNQLSAGFNLAIPSQFIDKAWFVVDGAKMNSISGSQLANSSIAISAVYLDELLGSAEEIVPGDFAFINLNSPESGGRNSVRVAIFDSIKLKRLTFGVEIAERGPSSLGKYSGEIGKDPDITIPLMIRQYGASKATTVDVQLIGNSLNTAKGTRCAFKINDGATSVGVPALLRFNSGLSREEYADNCKGEPHNIAAMRWKEMLGGAFAYEATMDLDVVYPLSPPDLELDETGNEWYGSASADGQVVVRAYWN
ncbi:hypothetical protein [Burkholderia territorii]|uniref:hypothetical protein n=1 Tax=Burkholderia territorii TaxID=1503055 RepID=UPI0012D9137C|nr:hypothetical protein [Burkholderia territorii]